MNVLWLALFKKQANAQFIRKPIVNVKSLFIRAVSLLRIASVTIFQQTRKKCFYRN